MFAIITKAAGSLMIGGALLAAIPAEADARNRSGYRSHGGGHGSYRGGWSGRGRDHLGFERHRRYRGGYRYGGYRGYGRYRGFGGYDGYGYGYGYPAYYGYGGYGGYYAGDAALAIGAGLLGVAIGTALGSRDDRYYEEEYYEARPPRTCPDGSYAAPDGYCQMHQQAPPQDLQPQQPPAEYWGPERG